MAKAGSNMNSYAEESHFSLSSDDASSSDHINAKTELERNTEESADDSNCNDGILGNLANEDDTRGDDLFQKWQMVRI